MDEEATLLRWTEIPNGAHNAFATINESSDLCAITHALRQRLVNWAPDREVLEYLEGIVRNAIALHGESNTVAADGN